MGGRGSYQWMTRGGGGSYQWVVGGEEDIYHGKDVVKEVVTSGWKEVESLTTHA